MKTIDTTLLDGGNKLAIGDKDVKDRVMREYIKNHEGALIVFDYDGRLYEGYKGEAILVDFSSDGGVAPDLLETLLHSQYGESPKAFASMMQELVVHTKMDRTSNDAFWSNISKAAFRDYIEYMCVLYKTEKNSPDRARGSQKRDLVSMGRYANEMMDLMNRVTEGRKEGKLNADPAYMSTPMYGLLKKYTQITRGKEASPFDGTLRNPGSSYTNAFQCAYLTLRTDGESFFKLMEMLEHCGDAIAQLPQLSLKELNSEASAPLILCGANKAAANQAIASIMLMAAACAASDANAGVTAIIPEMERWNLLDALKFVREEGFENFFIISSFSDIRKLSSSAGIDKESTLTELTEASDGVLWLYSTDRICEAVFETESTAKERRYKLNELGDDFAAYCDRRGLQYFSLPLQEESEEVKVRERKPIGRTGTAREPWIDRCCGREKKFMEEILYGGLPKDLYEDLIQLGYAEPKYWRDDEEEKKTNYGSINSLEELEKSEFNRIVAAYDRRAILSFLLDDEARLTRKEREMLHSPCFGMERLLQYFMGRDIRELIGRTRAQIKRIKERSADSDEKDR